MSFEGAVIFLTLHDQIKVILFQKVSVLSMLGGLCLCARSCVRAGASACVYYFEFSYYTYTLVFLFSLERYLQDFLFPFKFSLESI